jgi:hypothetical protein
MAEHFWYSPGNESMDYENLASAMEFGHVSSFDIPHWNTCRVKVGGEEIEEHYNLCADTPDAYERATDKIYLGEGEITSCRPMSIARVVERMRELGLIIPSVLERKVA